MLRIVYTIIMVAWISTSIAQTKIERKIDVKGNNRIELNFTWPDLVTIRGWEKDEVKVTGNVSINNGQNDDAFTLEIDESGGSIRVSSTIKNLKQLPKRVMIHKDGEDYFFNSEERSDPEVQKFLRENNHTYDYMNYGVIKDIQLIIYVPSSKPLEAYSEYGLIELVGMKSELAVSSKYGGLDIQVGQLTNQLKAGTKFGNKYSNLDLPLTSISYGDHPGKWDWISYGSRKKVIQELQSEFGNIYIRK